LLLYIILYIRILFNCEANKIYKYIILKDGRSIFQSSKVILFIHKFGTRTGKAHDLSWIINYR